MYKNFLQLIFILIFNIFLISLFWTIKILKELDDNHILFAIWFLTTLIAIGTIVTLRDFKKEFILLRKAIKVKRFVDPVFKQFLKKEKAQMFYYYFAKNYDYPKSSLFTPPINIIVNGFSWHLTQEGVNYWERINNKWQQYLILKFKSKGLAYPIVPTT